MTHASELEPRPAAAPWRTLDWWVRNPSTGEVVVSEPPNPPLVVWLAATGARLLRVLPGREQRLRTLADGALTVWAADELARGSAPYRRLMGLVVLARQLSRLLR